MHSYGVHEALSQNCEIHFPLFRGVGRMAGPIGPCSENELNTCTVLEIFFSSKLMQDKLNVIL